LDLGMWDCTLAGSLEGRARVVVLPEGFVMDNRPYVVHPVGRYH